VDLDRGVLIASEQAMTMDGRVTPGSSAPGLSPARMHGTIRISQRVIQ